MRETTSDGRSQREAERPHFRRLVAAYAKAALGVRMVRGSRQERGGAEGLDVVMLSAYPPQHYGTVSRLERWRPHLERRGCHITILCPTDDATYGRFRRGNLGDDYAFQHAALSQGLANLRRAADADVVVLHRGLFPFGPWQRPSFERALYRANPRVIYDYYDSIWERHRHANTHARGRLARWLNPADKIEQSIAGAAAITASNTYLADFARPLHDDVTVLPMLLEAAPYVPRRHAPADVVTLGWMGGPWNIERLKAIAPALQRAAAEVPIRVRVVCSKSIEIPGIDVECLDHPWSFESELRDLQSLDVGLLPLFDNPSDRGKSPLKLLQYAAAGLPIVASPVAVDQMVFRPGTEALFARSEDEWVRAIVDLASDSSRRASMGAAARAALEEHYTFEAHASRFHDLLQRVATTRRSRPVRRGPRPGSRG